MEEKKHNGDLDFIYEAIIYAPSFKDIMPVGGSCYITCLDQDGQLLHPKTLIHEAVRFDLPQATYQIHLAHNNNDTFHLVKYEPPLPPREIPTEPQYSGVAEENIPLGCRQGNHIGMRLRTGRYLKNGEFMACCTHCLEQRLIEHETDQQLIEKKRVYCY